MKKLMQPLFLSIALCSGLIISTTKLSCMSAEEQQEQDSLMEAVQRGDIAAVARFIASNADFNVTNCVGNTPLITAIQYSVEKPEGHELYIDRIKRYTEIAKLMINAGAMVNIRGFLGETALMCAASTCNEELVLLLLKTKADPTIQDTIHNTALTHAASLYKIAKAFNDKSSMASSKRIIQMLVNADPQALICAICTQLIGGNFTILKHCGHFFHADCIGPWLANHNTCPICRDKFSFSEEASFPNPQAAEAQSRAR